MSGKPRRGSGDATRKQAAPELGPVPELRVLNARDRALVGRISAPVALLRGEDVLIGRNEPLFYPPDEAPPRTMGTLGDTSVSRAQCELRWQRGCFFVERIRSARLPVRVSGGQDPRWVPLAQTAVALEPGSRLWLGQHVELMVSLRGEPWTAAVGLGRERPSLPIRPVVARTRVGRALGIQPAAVDRILGDDWGRSVLQMSILVGPEVEAEVVRLMASRRLDALLEAHDFEIKLAASAVSTPRTSFVRLMDHVGLPRASTVDGDVLHTTMRAVHGNLDLAARQLRVGRTALARRLKQPT